MSFMQPQAVRMSCFHVETTSGTEIVPTDLVGGEADREALEMFLEGEILDGFEVEHQEGFYSRLSAPGYLDRTDWSGPHQTEAMALAELEEMYGDE